MGTRCEIVLRDEEGTVVVLYKHWDGYPEYIVPLIEEAGNLMAWMARDQTHWLTYPEDVAAALIFYEGLVTLVETSRTGTLGTYAYHVDLEPIGRLADCIDYLYVIELDEGNRLEWDLKIYDVRPDFWDLGREERDKIYAERREGLIDELKELEKMTMKLKPDVPSRMKTLLGMLTIAQRVGE